MKEEWKIVNGFPLYEISNYGVIRSYMFSMNEPKIMKPISSTRGYFTIGLRKEKGAKQEFFRVHRLVVEHFVPDADMSLYVDHRDEDKSNNRLDNLRMCTVQENNEYYNSGKNSSKRTPPKNVFVNGVEHFSIHNAAKYIFSNVDRDVKLETIRREVASIARGQSKPRNMYGQFLITV